ncbi:MAG TPA: hypothetical protein VM580_34070 [Labilithrix sp.]|nr:hypothetical protein [Labilithrix sp.]
MSTPTDVTWIAIAALLVGALVRAIKADALPALLTKLFRPDGPPIAIPTRVLPWLALIAGGGLAFLEGLREGASYSDAGKAAVLAAASAVFGHELGSGLPGVKKVLGGIVLLVGLSASTTSCAFLQKHGPDIAEMLIRKTQCALENMNLPNEEIFVRCAVSAADVPRIESVLGTARREAAEEALSARMDERAKLGAASACVDGGANPSSNH